MVQQNWFQFCNFLCCLKTLWNGTIATSLRIISVIIDYLSINVQLSFHFSMVCPSSPPPFRCPVECHTRDAVDSFLRTCPIYFLLRGMCSCWHWTSSWLLEMMFSQKVLMILLRLLVWKTDSLERSFPALSLSLNYEWLDATEIVWDIFHLLKCHGKNFPKETPELKFQLRFFSSFSRKSQLSPSHACANIWLWCICDVLTNEHIE